MYCLFIYLFLCFSFTLLPSYLLIYLFIYLLPYLHLLLIILFVYSFN